MAEWGPDPQLVQNADPVLTQHTGGGLGPDPTTCCAMKIMSHGLSLISTRWNFWGGSLKSRQWRGMASVVSLRVLFFTKHVVPNSSLVLPYL
jgi:hypothetical protein